MLKACSESKNLHLYLAVVLSLTTGGREHSRAVSFHAYVTRQARVKRKEAATIRERLSFFVAYAEVAPIGETRDSWCAKLQS